MVSWGACHDVGQQGIDSEKKLSFIRDLEQYARPYITSEGELPVELEPYRLKIPVNKIHDVLAFASVCVSEGATLAAEAAVLGVPTVYINSLKLGYIDMLENYGLIKQAKDTQDAFELARSFLADASTTENCQQARQKLLSDKIDVTDYIVATIEEFGKKNTSG